MRTRRQVTDAEIEHASVSDHVAPIARAFDCFYLVNRTRMGGEVAAYSVPFRSRAASNLAVRAQETAAVPKP